MRFMTQLSLLGKPTSRRPDKGLYQVGCDLGGKRACEKKIICAKSREGRSGGRQKKGYGSVGNGALRQRRVKP